MAQLEGYIHGCNYVVSNFGATNTSYIYEYVTQVQTPDNGNWVGLLKS